VKKLLLTGTAVLLMAIPSYANAFTRMCGSSWNICANRGWGPGPQRDNGLRAQGYGTPTQANNNKKPRR